VTELQLEGTKPNVHVAVGRPGESFEAALDKGKVNAIIVQTPTKKDKKINDDFRLKKQGSKER
jgi:hypothetical protein